jgi:hypothetical protein
MGILAHPCFHGAVIVRNLALVYAAGGFGLFTNISFTPTDYSCSEKMVFSKTA